MSLSFDQTTTILRYATKTVVSSGAAAVISNAVKATTPSDIKKLKRLSIWVGTAAISGLVAEHSTKRVMKAYDSVVDAIKEAAVGAVQDDPDVVSGTVVD
jgi:hypothetical protein